MIEKVADFETSKEVIYKPVNKSMFDEDGNFTGFQQAYRYNEEKRILEKCYFQNRTVDRKKSKTWVYHYGIESLDLTEFKEGYSIDDFMEYVENYKDDLRIYFHNEKFDGTFIIYYMLKNDFKQIMEKRNLKIFQEQIDKAKTQEEQQKIIDYVGRFLWIEPFMTRTGEKYDFKKYLIMNGVYLNNKSKITGKFFTTSVNSLGIMYSIKIYYLKEGKPMHTVEIYDSLKLLPFSIEKLGKDFLNENMPKLKIDYDKIRPENRPDLLTPEDHDYLKRDIDIAARALTILKTSPDIEGTTDRQTTASLALTEFKTIFAKKILQKEIVKNSEIEKVFRNAFPILDLEDDSYVRDSYKGGFCYVFPQYKTTKDPDYINYSEDGMCVLDVNSLFPSVMLNNFLPFGLPYIVRNKGLKREGYLVKEGDKEILYDYYFVRVRVNFKLKKDHIPSVMLKGKDIKRNWGDEKATLPQNEYLTTTEGETIELIMTKDDFELMLEQYDFYNESDRPIKAKDLDIKEVYYFQTAKGFFDDYIIKFAKIKIAAGKAGNKSRRELAKLLLNSLYGKTGSKIRNSFKYYVIDEGYLQTNPKVETIDKPIYTPIAAAITAGGRRKTIETAQKILDYGLKKYGRYVYCYSDTDSIHTTLNKADVIDCLGDDVDVEKTGNFGLWDVEEADIIRSKFIRTKTYMEERKDGTFKSGVAGLPNEMQKCLTWENFKNGITLVGKLMPVQVEGGTALIETTFEIK